MQKHLGLLLLGFSFLMMRPVFAQIKLTGEFVLEADLSSYRLQPLKAMISFVKPGGGYIFDSVPVVNNKFVYTRTLTEPMPFTVSLKTTGEDRLGMMRGGRQDYISLYAVPSENKLILRDSLLKTASMHGGSAQISIQYQALMARIDTLIFTQNKLSAKLSAEGGTGRDEKIEHLSDSMTTIMDETVYRPYVLEHPSSPIALYALHRYASNPVWTPRKNLQPELVDSLFSLLSKNIRNLPSAVLLKQNLDVAKLTKPGMPLLDFTLPDTSGKMVSLSDIKGKYVFLDFWASWCVPCRKENPNVVNMFNKYKNSGFAVISVSLDKPEAKQAWLDAIVKDKLTAWTHLSDLKGFDSSPAQKYFVKSIPTNFLIGPDGKFIGRNLYGKALEAKLAQIFD